jgi:hypothetical protein
MKNLFQKINDIQKLVKSVHKGTTVKITERSSYTAVSHDDVTALLHDPIANAGIVAMPRMESCELETFEQSKTYQGQVQVTRNYLVKVWASVTFFNSDNMLEQFQTQCFAYAIDSGDKATGKAYSMAIKYCYLKTFMLESLDDEESRDFERTDNFANSRPEMFQAKKTELPKPTFSISESMPKNVATFPASDPQKNLLRKMGIKFDDNITKAEASKLIEEINKRN